MAEGSEDENTGKVIEYVMELADGVFLGDRLDRGMFHQIKWLADNSFACVSDFDRTVRRKIARDVARGLSALHREGIVHRDVKRMNVLLKQNAVAAANDEISAIFVRFW